MLRLHARFLRYQSSLMHACLFFTQQKETSSSTIKKQQMRNLGQIHTRRPMIHRSHKPVITSKREGKKTRMEHSRFEVLFSKACCGRRCGLLSCSFAPFFGFSSTLFLHCSFACLCHVRVSLLRFPSLFTLLFSFFACFVR